MIQTEEGHYSIAAHALKFEGSMFIYDPQRDIFLVGAGKRHLFCIDFVRAKSG